MLICGSCGLPLCEAFDTLMQAVLLDQLRPAYPVFRLGRKLRVAPAVKVKPHNLRQTITPDIQPLSVPQTLKKVKLLFGHLEQLAIVLAVEGLVGQKEKRRARVHDGVGVATEIVGGLADKGHPLQGSCGRS